MRLAKGAFDQREDLIVQMQPRELFGKCLYQRPLPHIFLRALLLVARTVIVDVSLPLDCGSACKKDPVSGVIGV
ncbi:hypothetical protein SBA_ch1_30580 [Sphingomonas bisphenolicum]|uniref:Uncharacterized protein n=1 Tax=Sphingomonas bisphenolicum TaxID=296544 RepID=A0ABN5WLM1_9SPHN|nr:hypothetical protein SBA_ch1_30580 [Sphingomonas bisphenolicum]